MRRENLIDNQNRLAQIREDMRLKFKVYISIACFAYPSDIEPEALADALGMKLRGDQLFQDGVPAIKLLEATTNGKKYLYVRYNPEEHAFEEMVAKVQALRFAKLFKTAP